MVKVLIVDDDDDVTFSLRRSLKSMSSQYDISVANSGQECLKKVKKNRPDIVLLDIMMPEMDGWEVNDELQTMNIPVLFITGKAYMIEESRLRKVEYLLKPIDIRELEANIKQILKMWS